MADLKRVVLVDDSTDEGEFVRRALAEQCPEAELRVFRSGTEAIAYLVGEGGPHGNGRRAHVVLLDLKLPGLDGHAILGTLREQSTLGDLPVVIFTSSREPSDLARAYALGANSYVVKPLVYERYVEVVGLLVRYWVDVNVPESREGNGGA